MQRGESGRSGGERLTVDTKQVLVIDAISSHRPLLAWGSVHWRTCWQTCLYRKKYDSQRTKSSKYSVLIWSFCTNNQLFSLCLVWDVNKRGHWHKLLKLISCLATFNNWSVVMLWLIISMSQTHEEAKTKEIGDLEMQKYQFYQQLIHFGFVKHITVTNWLLITHHHSNLITFSVWSRPKKSKLAKQINQYKHMITLTPR